MNSKWLPFKDKLYSPTQIDLPKISCIPELIDWVYTGEPATDQATLNYIYRRMIAMPNAAVNTMDSAILSDMAGVSNVNLINWLADRRALSKKVHDKLPSHSRGIFREIWSKDMPTVAAQIRDTLEMLHVLIRVYNLSQMTGIILAIGLDELVEGDLYNVQQRSIMMYPSNNTKTCPVVQLVEEILQAFVIQKITRRVLRTYVGLTSELWFDTDGNTHIQDLKTTLTRISDGFQLVQEIKRICVETQQLQVNPTFQTTHTELSTWMELTCNVLFGTHTPHLTLHTRSVLYSQICDLISNTLKVMIIQKKYIGIRINSVAKGKEAKDAMAVEGEEIPADAQANPGDQNPKGARKTPIRALAAHASVEERYQYWKKRRNIDRQSLAEDAKSANKPTPPIEENREEQQPALPITQPPVRPPAPVKPNIPTAAAAKKRTALKMQQQSSGPRPTYGAMLGGQLAKQTPQRMAQLKTPSTQTPSRPPPQQQPNNKASSQEKEEEEGEVEANDEEEVEQSAKRLRVSSEHDEDVEGEVEEEEEEESKADGEQQVYEEMPILPSPSRSVAASKSSSSSHSSSSSNSSSEHSSIIS